MFLHLAKPLTDEEVARIQTIAAEGTFVDGGATAPGLAEAGVKRNEQLATNTREYKSFTEIVRGALGRHETFRTACLPKVILPPLLARYRTGMGYGSHVDNPIRNLAGPGGAAPVRLDLSLTLFLTGPKDYDGGELVIETPYGEKAVKLPAGQGVVYPTTMVHRVNDVTSGERLVAVTWIQSLVADETQRRMLFELAILTQWALTVAPEAQEARRLHNLRTNLVRMWATA